MTMVRSVGASPTRLGRASARSGAPHARVSHGDLYFYAVMIFFSLSPLIRIYGGLLYIAMLLVCVVYVIMRRAWIGNLAFLLFCVIGVLYAAGSYARIFPPAWTVTYDRGAIPQQAIFVIGFYFFVAAGRVFWADLLVSEDATSRLWQLTILGSLSTKVIGLLMGDVDVDQALSGFFSSLSNASMMSYLGLSLLVMVRYGRHAGLLAVVLTPFMAIFTPFAQNTLAAFAFFGLVFTPWPRLSLAGAISVFLLLWVVAFGFRDALAEIDPTWTVRIDFALEAFRALRDNLGVGVGFGTEAVTATSLFGSELTASGVAPEEMDQGWIYVSTHNSFVATFFRLGILGGLAFLVVFFVYLFPSAIRDIRLERVACFAYFILFLLFFSNPGLESQGYHVGAGFAGGLILALRRHSIPTRSGAGRVLSPSGV